jgi:hypothetical protein
MYSLCVHHNYKCTCHVQYIYTYIHANACERPHLHNQNHMRAHIQTRNNELVTPLRWYFSAESEDCLGGTTVAECLFEGGHDLILGLGANSIMDGPELSWYFFCKQMARDGLICALPQGTPLPWDGDIWRLWIGLRDNLRPKTSYFIGKTLVSCRFWDLASRSLAWHNYHVQRFRGQSFNALFLGGFNVRFCLGMSFYGSAIIWKMVPAMGNKKDPVRLGLGYIII